VSDVVELPGGVSAQLWICGTCRGLRGSWWPRSGTPVREQQCRCGPRQEERWPGFDFNRVAELCRCCGLDLLRSGSRWSVWLCRPCKERALSLDAWGSVPVVPIGRHSIQHGLGLAGSDLDDDGAVEAFVAAVVELTAAQQRLERWAEARLEANLQLLGWAGEGVAVADYLRAAPAVAPGPERCVDELVATLADERRHRHGAV